MIPWVSENRYTSQLTMVDARTRTRVKAVACAPFPFAKSRGAGSVSPRFSAAREHVYRVAGERVAEQREDEKCTAEERIEWCGMTHEAAEGQEQGPFR